MFSRLLRMKSITCLALVFCQPTISAAADTSPQIDELIDLAVEQMVKRSKSRRFHLSSGTVTEVEQYEYKSVSDFKKRHEECCRLRPPEDDPKRDDFILPDRCRYIGFVDIRPRKIFDRKGAWTGQHVSPNFIRLMSCDNQIKVFW